MSETYQAVYDAIRSKISGCDISQAVEEAIRNSGIGDQVHRVGYEYTNAAVMQQEACVLYRPTLTIDGNQWCALYGDNLQDGVAGFGDSPAQAMIAFNKAWHESLATPQEQGE